MSQTTRWGECSSPSPHKFYTVSQLIKFHLNFQQLPGEFNFLPGITSLFLLELLFRTQKISSSENTDLDKE